MRDAREGLAFFPTHGRMLVGDGSDQVRVGSREHLQRYDDFEFVVVLGVCCIVFEGIYR